MKFDLFAIARFGHTIIFLNSIIHRPCDSSTVATTPPQSLLTRSLLLFVLPCRTLPHRNMRKCPPRFVVWGIVSIWHYVALLFPLFCSGIALLRSGARTAESGLPSSRALAPAAPHSTELHALRNGDACLVCTKFCHHSPERRYACRNDAGIHYNLGQDPGRSVRPCLVAECVKVM
jgi:hypothetical protein